MLHFRKFRALWQFIGFALASLILGFVLTHGGMITRDTIAHYERSRWLIHQYNFLSHEVIELPNLLKWYGPLWELVLGFFSETLLPGMRDPMWVRAAVTFSLFPITIALVWKLLVRAGVARSTAALASAMFLALIRIGGQSLINTVDFPFACTYLLVILASWVLIRDEMAEVSKRPSFTMWRRVAIGVIAIVPFMIRPPVITQFLAVIGMLFLYSVFVERRGSILTRLTIPGVAFLSGFAFMWLLWPSIWHKPPEHYKHWCFGGWHSWLQSFGGFVRFWWKGEVRAFGMVMQSDTLPRWYPLMWPPVVMTPVALAAFFGGLMSPLAKWRSIRFQSMRWNGLGLSVDLSLQFWLVIFTLVAWGGILAYGPVLYDEDRHLLFLFPPLMILAALGLDWMADRTKYLFALVLVVSSLFAYAQWGRFSYVYKSPLIAKRDSKSFMGDYWAVCIPRAISALKGIAPAGAEVAVRGAIEVAQPQYDRLKAHDAEYGPYDLKPDPSGSRDYYYVLYNRHDDVNQWLKDAPSKGAEVKWVLPMPPDDAACAILHYPQGRGP